MPSNILKNISINTLQVLTILILSASSYAATAASPLSFIESSAVPGGIAVVTLDTQQFPTSGAKPAISWNGRAVSVADNGGQYIALVGIPLSTSAGNHSLSITGVNGQKKSVSFEVNAKTYEEQRLIIKNKRKVNPDPFDMERINKENKRLKDVKTYKADRMIADSFDWPLAGIMSSPFGLKRFYNDQARRPHGGIDMDP